MVRPVRPFTMRCKDCGWSQTVMPLSDVLRYEDCPEVCPRCKGQAVQMEQATALEVAVAKVKRLLGSF
jgi:Zn finger protein HypA/HybF involved in hydrogenase expression